MNGFSARIGWVAVLITGMTWQQSALGFYFQGWPAGPKKPPSLVLPTAPSIPTTKVQDPPNMTTDPGAGPPHGTPGGGNPGGGTPDSDDPPPSHAAPEPGTAALTVVGLGAVALLRRGRRMKPRQV